MNSVIPSFFSYVLFGLGFLSLAAQDAPPLYISEGTEVSAQKLLISLDGLSLYDQGELKQDSSTLRFYPDKEERAQYFHSKASFHKLELALEGKSLLLESDLKLANELLMESGHLNLNSHTLFLTGESAQIKGENEQNRIKGAGAIEASRNLFYPQLVKPGNMGLEISVEADLGLSRIRRIHTLRQSDSLSLVERQYELIPALKVDVPISISLDYFQVENPFGQGQKLIPLQEKNHHYGKLTYFTDRPFRNKMDIILPPVQKDWQLSLTHEEKAAPRGPQQLEVGPNPFFSRLDINWVGREDRAIGVKLYASGGNLVYEQAISAYGTSFSLENLRELTAGLYVLKIETDSGILLSQTLIKAARE
ncbi:MAG: hypothetical protein AAGD28_03990 [Bacteroidota bacterium]